MSINIELQQLVDLALATPEVGAVNFNILRGVLREILKHLGLSKNLIAISSKGDFKSAHDFIKEGFVALRPSTPEVPETRDAPTAPETLEGKEEVNDEEQSDSLVDAAETRTSELGDKKEAEKPVDSPKRSIEVLLGKTESLKNLQKTVTDMQFRLDALESTPSAPVDMVHSVASLVRRDSKTPAHDMVQLINVEGRLEAVENSVEGLTEMVDALTTDLRELKDLTPDPSEIEKLRSFQEQMKKRLGDMASIEKLKALEESFGEFKETLEETKLASAEGLGRNAVDAKDIEQYVNRHVETVMASMSNLLAQQQNQGGQVPIVLEPPEILQKLQEQEKALQQMKSELKKLEKIVSDNAREKKNTQELASFKEKLQTNCKKINSTSVTLKEMKEELGSVKSISEDNQLQIHQLKSNVALLQREAQQIMMSPGTGKKDDTTKEEEPAARRRSCSTDRDEMSVIRTMIFDLQEEKDKLKQANSHLGDELYKKQKHVDDLYSLVEQLQDLKADKDLVSEGFEFKADKREVDMKVGRDDFDHCMGLVDQSLRDLLQRLDGHEDTLKQAMQALSCDVGKKLDKEEVGPLKEYLEARMKSMKPKPAEKPPQEDFAAGFRKVLLTNFNCISCDRPVKYAQEGTFPVLPTIQAMPGAKSNRPYTTFELEQIRQHMLQGGLEMTKERFELLEKQRQKLQKDILKLSGAQDLQELAEMTDRACGGGHTLTYPHSRAIFRGLQFNKEEFEFLAPVQKELQAVDILGQDGHIYKGLVDNLPCLPHLPQKPKSAGSRADSRHSRRSLRRSGTPTPSPAPPQEQTVDDQDNSS